MSREQTERFQRSQQQSRKPWIESQEDAERLTWIKRCFIPLSKLLEVAARSKTKVKVVALARTSWRTSWIRKTVVQEAWIRRAVKLHNVEIVKSFRWWGTAKEGDMEQVNEALAYCKANGIRYAVLIDPTRCIRNPDYNVDGNKNLEATIPPHGCRNC